ncbi:MAG: hypothetical protein KGY76_01795 [Candidatus Thermoplasmatota archaeon]|nr:hypothetical protein [Candidatus Thermoplasmatota archaeon]
MAIRAETLPEDKIETPPRWVTRIFLGLKPPLKFERKEILQGPNDENRMDQFLREASKYHLIKKLDRGKYFAVDPCTAMNCWAVEDYYSEILVLESLFRHLDISHSFLCLSGYEYADYVPEKPMVVTKRKSRYRGLDNFFYDFSSSCKIDLKVMKKDFKLPILSEEETSLLFMSTYLSREVKAGKEILESLEIDEELENKLLGLGYSSYGGDNPVDIEVGLPDWVRKKQKQIGLSRLKEVATR